MLANDRTRLGRLLFNEARTRADHLARAPAVRRPNECRRSTLVVVMTAKRRNLGSPRVRTRSYGKARWQQSDGGTHVLPPPPNPFTPSVVASRKGLMVHRLWGLMPANGDEWDCLQRVGESGVGKSTSKPVKTNGATIICPKPR